MPVKIINRTYTTPFKTSSTTNWLLGNVGDWQQLTLECEFIVEQIFSIQESLTIQQPNILKLNNGKTWGELGFAVGMDIYLYYDVYSFGSSTNYPNAYSPMKITSLLGDTIETDTNFAQGYKYGQIAPIRTADEEIRNVKVYSYQTMEGIEIEYTHLSNKQVDSGGTISFLDGTKTNFVAEETNDTPDINPINPKFPLNTPVEVDHYLTPYQSGMSVEKVTITYRGVNNWGRLYDIDLYYMVCPFGDLLEFQDNIAPDVVVGEESITDTFKIYGFPVYNNPNVSISNDPKKTALQGNVGWFDENFNQLPNLFTHTPVVYTNASGTVVSALDYATEVTMNTSISGIPNLGAFSVFQYGFIWLDLTEDSYKKTEYPLHKNRKVSTGGNAGNLGDWFAIGNYSGTYNGYSHDGAAMDVKNISFTVNGTNLDVSLTFIPNAAFNTFMSAKDATERGYCIWVSVGDSAPNTNQSDRVSLKLDFNTLETFIEPIGEYDGLTISFTDHPQTYTDTPNPSGNNIFIEDDLLAKVSFREDTAVGVDIPTLNDITFGFLVENSTTGQQYILDSNSVDLTQYPDPTQYNFDTSRNFKLGTGNTKNWFKVDYDATNNSGTEKGVLGWYGYKVRWEDWIKRFPTPPNDFYDNTLSQNGLNNDWFHYYNTAGWNFYFYVNIGAVLNGANVVYQNLKQLVINDYDSNVDVDVTFNYYRDNNGVQGVLLAGGTDPISGLPLGVIPVGEDVWLDIVYDWVGGGAPADWASQVIADANVYSTSCIEVDGGAGQGEFRQLSSVWASEYDNPLYGIVGATLLSIRYVSATQLIMECRINSNKLIAANRYKISGRIGCK